MELEGRATELAASVENDQFATLGWHAPTCTVIATIIDVIVWAVRTLSAWRATL